MNKYPDFEYMVVTSKEYQERGIRIWIEIYYKINQYNNK